ncbi:MAG: ribulose-phosphate 3-epimerase [Lachnospiraceae bacterium]|nr:ribulose-phosphate 3-epimerase [Lachnospiraceae bacterium]
MNYCLSPSILAADLSRLGEEVRSVDEAGAQYIHIDIMDGRFVPNLTFGISMVESMRHITDKIIDVHMMVESPHRFIPVLVEAGADIISVHVEACRHLDQTISEIKKAGAMASVALCPATPLSTIEYILPKLDMVLIMTVNPGFGGQKLLPYTIDKLRDLKQMIDNKNLSVDIEIDGGVNLENVDTVMDAGANIIVAGSSIFQGGAPAENTEIFLSKMRDRR